MRTRRPRLATASASWRRSGLRRRARVAAPRSSAIRTASIELARTSSRRPRAALLPVARSSAIAARSAARPWRSRARRWRSSRAGSGGHSRADTAIDTAAPIAVSQMRCVPRWAAPVPPRPIRNSALTDACTFGLPPTRSGMPATAPRKRPSTSIGSRSRLVESSATPMPTPANTPRMRPSETLTALKGSPLIATKGTSAAKIGRGSPASVASHQAIAPPIVIFNPRRVSPTRSRSASWSSSPRRRRSGCGSRTRSLRRRRTWRAPRPARDRCPARGGSPPRARRAARRPPAPRRRARAARRSPRPRRRG